MIAGEYASAIDNRGEMSTHRQTLEKSQMSHATNVQIGGTVNNYAAHSPGMPHTPGISYVNGVGYLDVGTAPAGVISRFNDFLRSFASLSQSLSHLLARESHLCRKYRFQSPADSRWLLPLTHRDASGMNSELTDAVRRLDSLVVRQRLDSRAAALEELLCGDVGNEVMNAPSIRTDAHHITNDLPLAHHPLNINSTIGNHFSGATHQVVEETRMVELPYQTSTSDTSRLMIATTTSSNHGQPSRITQNHVGQPVHAAPSQISLSIVEPSNKMVVHGKKKKFACHICGKEYNTKQYVKQHVKSIHKTDSKGSIGSQVGIDPKTNNTTLLPQMNGQIGNGQDTQFIQKRFICHADGCGMKFQTSNLLQKHQRNVHGMSGGGGGAGNANNQSGGQNGISLNNNSIQLINPSPVVQRHQTTNNGNTRVTLAPSSTRTTNSMSNGVTSSSSSMHGQSNPNSNSTNNQGQNEPEHNMVECDICGKNVREQSLPAHKKRHELAEKRPFKCDICGKGFMRTVTLRDHMNTHNGVKPHKCRVCGRGWASRPNMLKHVREKHPEARIPMGDKDQMVEEIDVKTDPRSTIEYAPEPMGQVRSQIQITQGPTGLSSTVTSTTDSNPPTTTPSGQPDQMGSILSHRGDFRPAQQQGQQSQLHMPTMSRAQTIVSQQSPMTIPMDH